MTPTTHRRPLRLAAAIAALAAVATTTACSSDDSGSADRSSSTVDEAAPSVAAEEETFDGDAGARSDHLMSDSGIADGAEAARDDVGDGTGVIAEPIAELDLTDAAIISTGWVELESDDVGTTRFDIRKIVDAHRGAVTEQETSTGEGGEVETARMVIRLPSARFSDAMAALEGTATLTDSSSSGQDVSAEVVDVEARVRAQRKSVARIEALLARAETIEQVVSIESQLATRQADLDALLSRQQWLADQTSLSTITVYVQQPGENDEEPAEEERTGFLGGLSDGWDSFVDALVVGGTVLGFVVPWLAAVALLGLPLWLALRRRTRRPAPTT